jgi:hypothetical protein
MLVSDKEWRLSVDADGYAGNTFHGVLPALPSFDDSVIILALKNQLKHSDFILWKLLGGF